MGQSCCMLQRKGDHDMTRKVMVVAMVGLMVAGLSEWAGGACCAGKSAPKASGACSASSVMTAADQPAPVEMKAQVNCPVMGGPANKSFYADHNGKRVYFCCGACLSSFKADPDKYMKKLADEGVQLEDTPATP